MRCGERRGDRNWEKGIWRDRGVGGCVDRDQTDIRVIEGMRKWEGAEKGKVKHTEGGVKCGTEKVSGAIDPKLEMNLFWAAETGDVQTAMRSPGSDKKLALPLKRSVTSSTYTTPLHITLS